MSATASVDAVKCPLATTIVVSDCLCLMSYSWLCSRKPVPKTQTYRYPPYIPINAGPQRNTAFLGEPGCMSE